MSKVVRVRGRIEGLSPVCDVLVRDGAIAAIEPASSEPADVGAADRFLGSPLVDLQHNGCLGRAFNRPTTTVDELRERRQYLLRHGVGRLLPTLITAPLDRLAAALANLVSARKADADLAAVFPGFHVEGPWLSPLDGYRGAHNRDWIRDPNWNDFRRLQDAAEGLIRILTLAPERPGAIAFIEKVAGSGVTVSLAHCDPDADCVRAAADAGARMVTHLGNGMASTIHRHRNPLWSYLSDDRLAAGLIADGFHLPDALLRTALRAKGSGRVFLVSDASDLSGLPPGVHPYEYQTLTIEPNGYLHVTGSEYLAGAWFQLDHCVAKAARDLGCSQAQAWRLGSSDPARIMNLPVGSLAVGTPADLVVADWGTELKIEAVFVAGERRI